VVVPISCAAAQHLSSLDRNLFCRLRMDWHSSYNSCFAQRLAHEAPLRRIAGLLLRTRSVRHDRCIDIGNALGPMINEVKAVWPWMGNVVEAVYTVAHGLWITFRTWIKTYRPERKSFTEHFEYPELPVPVAARYRGFHRFDLTTCISCDQCAKACPVDCIYIGKERVEGGKGFKITGYTIDYTKCMFCALCVEPCPVDCIFMGATHDLSCYSRDGCIVDFARMPLDVAWGRSTLNPTAVADAKVITEPVHGGPNQ
jgi:NADH-quinone oxidoreductase subunit I